MDLSKQVVSLELAKELKELGMTQDSVWFWNDYLTSKPSLSEGKRFKDKLATDGTYIRYSVSAFTVAELGEMLPRVSYSMNLAVKNKKPHWFCDVHLLYPRTYAQTEADARAKMLIYLIKGGIIKEGEI